MKTLVTVFVCAAFVLGGGRDAIAHKTHRGRALSSSSAHASKRSSARDRDRARERHRGPATLAEKHDEIVLSPNLLRKLQANLIDGGYLSGTIDGRLTRRTRRALAEFQRDYHMAGTGSLDRATAEALLGHDEISSFLVAHAN